MSKGFYAFIEGQLRTWALRIGEFIRREKPIIIQAYPDRISSHAAIILASKISAKTDAVALFLYRRQPLNLAGALNILVGYDGEEAKNHTIVSIGRKNSLYTEAYTALLISEEISIIKDHERIAALSSIFQSGGKVGEDHPVLADTRVAGLVKIYRKFPAITGAYTKNVAQALYQTINPLYPTFTGQPLDKIEKKLREIGVDPEKKMIEQGREETKKLLETLLDDMKTYNKGASVKDMTTTLMAADISGVKVDLRELGEAIDIALETSPGLLIDYYSRGDPRLLLENRISWIEAIAEGMRTLIDKKYEKKNGLVIITSCQENSPVGVIGELSRKLGLIGRNDSLACRWRGEKYTSVYEPSPPPQPWEGPLIPL